MNPCTNQNCLDSGLACPECILVDVEQLDGCDYTLKAWGIRIYNYTPHDIVLLLSERAIHFQPEKLAVRLKMETQRIVGTPFSETIYGEPENLPVEQKGIFLIVSQMVKNTLPNRKDLVVPAEIVRDEKGNITGCRSFGI